MNFGDIEHYLLIGGGQLLFDVALSMNKSGLKFGVITSQRHQQEPIRLDSTPMCLVDGLAASRIQYHVSSDINSDRKVSDLVTERTLGISIGSAWIFPQSFITRFNGRLLNVHLHRLPERRGAMASYSWDILDGTTAAGVAIHQVDAGINTGDVVRVERFDFPEQLRTPVDHQRYADSQAQIVVEGFVKDVMAGQDFLLTSQADDQSNLWPQLNTGAHGFIDWTWTLEEIERFIHAFDEPYQGASTFLNGSRVHLKNCLPDHTDGPFHPFKTGIIYRKSDQSVFVAAKEGSLVISHITDTEGTSIFPWVRVGDRLHTPREVLDRARDFRAVYTSEGLNAP